MNRAKKSSMLGQSSTASAEHSGTVGGTSTTLARCGGKVPTLAAGRDSASQLSPASITRRCTARSTHHTDAKHRQGAMTVSSDDGEER
jgi:hypothetical protein